MFRFSAYHVCHAACNKQRHYNNRSVTCSSRTLFSQAVLLHSPGCHVFTAEGSNNRPVWTPRACQGQPFPIKQVPIEVWGIGAFKFKNIQGISKVGLSSSAPSEALLMCICHECCTVPARYCTSHALYQSTSYQCLEHKVLLCVRVPVINAWSTRYCLVSEYQSSMPGAQSMTCTVVAVPFTK